MLRSICRKLLSLPSNTESLTNLSNTHLQLAHVNAFITTTKPFSTSTSTSHNDDYGVDNPFVVSYLMNFCGLPREKAIRACRKLNFKSPEGPDKVLAFFKNQGFSDAMITRIVTYQPSVLAYQSPCGSFLPKIEFLGSIGFRKPEVLEFVSYNTTIFTLSLERSIIPAYDFLKSVLVSDEKIIYALKRGGWIFSSNILKKLVPNIELLTKIGVPTSNVALLLKNYPWTLLRKPALVCEYVDEVRGMGFDVSKSMFVVGLYVMSSKSTRVIRERCIKVYRRWGWSDDDISFAFRRYPQCMLLSEKNITQKMDFLVNKMGLHAGEIAEFPVSLGSSLERTIIPRCAVIHFLLSKGLIKKWKLSTVFLMSNELFLRRFVTKYVKNAPELISTYDGKLDVFSK